MRLFRHRFRSLSTAGAFASYRTALPFRTCEPVAHTLTARAGRGTRSRRRFRRPPAHAHRAGAPRPVRTLPATRVSPRARHAHGSPMGRQDTPQPHRTRSPTAYIFTVYRSTSGSAPQSRWPRHRDRLPAYSPLTPIAIWAYSPAHCSRTEGIVSSDAPPHAPPGRTVSPYCLPMNSPIMPNGTQVHASSHEGNMLPPKALAHPWA